DEILPVVEALAPAVLVAVIDERPDEPTVDDVARVARRFGDCGTRMAIEFVPFGVVADLAGADQLCSRIGAGVGICLDSWHFLRGLADWSLLARISAERLAYVQFSDALPPVSNDMYAETVHRRALPGDGDLDLARFA